MSTDKSLSFTPPIGSILRISDKMPGFLHSYQPGEFVVRVGPESGEVLDKDLFVNPIRCINRHGTGQWLVDGCYATEQHNDLSYAAQYELLEYLRNYIKASVVSFDEEAGKLKLDDPYNPTALGSHMQLLFGRPRTQKGRGIRVLVQMGYLPQKQVFLCRKNQDPKALLTDLPKGIKIMARPCPSKPRHGFVDSRVVKTTEDLNKVIDETLAQDPHGEVICMPFMPADYSAVLTNTGVTMGKGTNGATAGSSAIHIPCNSDLEYSLGIGDRFISCRDGKKLSRAVRALRYISHDIKKTRLFIETVGDRVVQLRTGPLMSTGNETAHSWSPFSIVSPRVVLTVTGEEDFLEYEQLLDDLRKAHGPDHVIVHFPSGSLLSHFAVQAVAKGLPIVTGKVSKIPKVDQLYRFGAIAELVIFGNAYRQAVVRGIKLGATTIPTNETVSWAIAIIQGIGSATKTIPSVGLIVAASMILMRAGTAVCLGEYRHFFRKGPGLQKYQPMGPLGIPLGYRFTKDEQMPSRDSVYKEVFTNYDWTSIDTYFLMQQYMFTAKFDFKHRPWRSAYGGPKWGDCTEAALSVFEAMLPVMRMSKTFPLTTLQGHDPMFGDKLLNSLVMACNRLITVSHNSNKCLTKLVSPDILNIISCGRTGILIATSPLTMKAIK